MDASQLPPGTVIDKYTVEDAIGTGGMAMVWRVRHNDLGSVHALKVLQMRSTAVRERLVQEGRVQAALRHPNLVAVTDLVVLEGGDPGLIMEYVPGPSLADLLEHHRLSLEQADALARGFLDGVAEAHRAGLVHRDLKPGNILLEPSAGTFVPKVADFGIAKVLADGGPSPSIKTRTGMTLGTPHYMAPEQILDASNVGPAADVFALGVILYETATGRRPFDGPSEHAVCTSVLEGEVAPPRAVVPELPETVERAILAALAKDPEERPATVEALADAWFAGRPALATGARPFPDVERVTTVQHANGQWVPSGATIPQKPAPSLASQLALLGSGLGVGGVLLVSVAVIAFALRRSEPEIAPGTSPAPASTAQAPAPVPSPAPLPDVTPEPDPEVVPAPEPEADAEPEPVEELLVRLATVDELAARGGVEAWQELDRYAREDPSRRVRDEAWKVILDAWTEDRPGSLLLEPTLSWKIETGSREEAIAALEGLGERADRGDSLLPGLERRQAMVRAAALDAVLAYARRKPDAFDWRPHVAKLTDAGTDDVRKKAERVLRKL